MFYRASIYMKKQFKWAVPTKYHKASYDVLCTLVKRDLLPHIAIVLSENSTIKIKAIHGLSITPAVRTEVNASERQVDLTFEAESKLNISGLDLTGIMDYLGALSQCNADINFEFNRNETLPVTPVATMLDDHVNILELQADITL
jgi:hypothetical protein